MQDTISLRGEVYFPNLEFEKMAIDFGCILNDTEVTRYVNITNNSPMEVKYKWSFLIEDEPVAFFRKPAVEAVSPMAVEDIELGEGQRSPTPEGSVGGEEEQRVEVEVFVQGAETPREGEELLEVLPLKCSH